MKVTPEFVVSFETAVNGLISTNWDRVAQNLMWDRVMKQRPLSTKKQILTWLLETARIYPEGDGGNKRFDDMVAATMSYEISNAGAGLELTKNEIEDNQMKDNPSVGALDYASKWAKDIGAAAAYYPQQKLFEMILAGTTALGYDGRPFFDTAHPVNPNGGTDVYSNHIASVPLVVTSGTTEQDNLLLGRKNLGKAIAAVRQQRFINGVPRFLRVSGILVQSIDYDYTKLIVGAGQIAATTNTSPADRPLDVMTAPELDSEADGVYYLVVEDTLSDDLGALVWAEREPFSMSTYGPIDDAVLQRMKVFQWMIDGRNEAVYGHPYLLYRCKPGA